jgi:hypothetical protein
MFYALNDELSRFNMAIKRYRSKAGGGKRLDGQKQSKHVSELVAVNRVRHRRSEWRGFGKETPGASPRRITRGNRG